MSLEETRAKVLGHKLAADLKENSLKSRAATELAAREKLLAETQSRELAAVWQRLEEF
jgi:hypothetical protein